MNFTKRRVSTKCGNPSVNIEDIRREFLAEIVEAVELDDVPPELIFNWDQTAILLVPSAQWTMDKKGRKRVPIAGHNDKRQVTAVMCGSLTGEVLPIQMIYEGKTKRCHPTFDFPRDWLISHSPNHWSNENTMVEYIEEIIVPYVDRKRADLNLNFDYPAVAIFDNFKGQLTERVTQVLEQNHIQSVLIPANHTGELQPMDISVNKVIKSFIRSRFSEWYAEQVTEQFYNDDYDPVDLSAARMKCLGAQWMLQVYEHLADNPQVVVNGFRHAGVYRALGLLDEGVELPDYSDSTVESDYDDGSDIQSDSGDSSSSDEVDDSSLSDDSSSSDDERSCPHLLVDDIFSDSD